MAWWHMTAESRCCKSPTEGQFILTELNKILQCLQSVESVKTQMFILTIADISWRQQVCVSAPELISLN